MPSPWLPGIWVEDGKSDFPDLATAEATIQAVMGHYNQTAALINADGWIEPIYEEDINSSERPSTRRGSIAIALLARCICARRSSWQLPMGLPVTLRWL
jgi:hypothetical protein